MRTIVKSVVGLALFTCVLASALQAHTVARPLPLCLRTHGVCLAITCNGVCSTACGCVK